MGGGATGQRQGIQLGKQQRMSFFRLQILSFGDDCRQYATMCFQNSERFCQPLLHQRLPCMQIDIVALSKRVFETSCTCPFKLLPYDLEWPYVQVETPDPVITPRSLVTPWTTWGRRAGRFGSRI